MQFRHMYDICLNIMIKHESKTICESDQLINIQGVSMGLNV